MTQVGAPAPLACTPWGAALPAGVRSPMCGVHGCCHGGPRPPSSATNRPVRSLVAPRAPQVLSDSATALMPAVMEKAHQWAQYWR